MALTNDQILAGNDDIQTRNKVLQADLKIANANRQKLLGALTRVAPVSTESFAERGLTNRNQAFRTPEDQSAHADYTKQLADSDKEMAGITARAQQITKDATAYTTSIGAQNIASSTGVPLKYQDSAPSAPASTGAAAGATAPAGGQPTNTGFVPGRVTHGSGVDPMFADVQSGVFSSYEGGAGRPAPTPTQAPARKPIPVNLGVSKEYGGDGQTKKDSLASSIDKNGVPTYDNSSIQRMLERDGQSAIGGGAAQSPATPAAAIYNSYQPPQSQALGYSIGGTGTIGGPQDPNKKYLSDLDTAISRLSINPNMRSKRDMLVQAMALRNGFINQQNQIASTEGIAAQSRAAELARTGMTEAGADRRNTATLQNQMAVEGLRQNGDTYRTLLGAMPKPQYTTDDNGNYVQINGATWTPVTGTDGKPLALPQDKSGIERIKAEAPYFAEALKTLNAQAADPMASQEERSAAAAQARAILQRSPFGGQQAQAKPDLATFKSRAKAQGSKMTDAQLESAYSNL